MEQRRELNKLLAVFSVKEGTPREWLQAGERILAIGPPGPQRLLPALAAPLRDSRRDYQDAFVQQARRARLDRFAEVAKEAGKSRDRLAAELKKDRQTVLDLLAMPSLTGDEIRRRADPAMERLNAALTVNRQAVLERAAALRQAQGGLRLSKTALRQQREELLALFALRERCRSAVAAETAPTKGSGPEGDTGTAPRAAFDPETSLARFEEFAAFAAMPMDKGARRTLLANAKLEPKLKPTETAGLRDLNRIRVLLGLKPLAIDLKLCEAARGHSTDMRTEGFFSHTSPVPGKRSPWDRAKKAGTSAQAENIAYGARTGRAAIRMWFHSPGHLKNLLGGFGRVGLGHDGRWTLMLGR